MRWMWLWGSSIALALVITPAIYFGVRNLTTRPLGIEALRTVQFFEKRAALSPFSLKNIIWVESGSRLGWKGTEGKTVSFLLESGSVLVSNHAGRSIKNLFHCRGYSFEEIGTIYELSARTGDPAMLRVIEGKVRVTSKHEAETWIVEAGKVWRESGKKDVVSSGSPMPIWQLEEGGNRHLISPGYDYEMYRQGALVAKQPLKLSGTFRFAAAVGNRLAVYCDGEHLEIFKDGRKDLLNTGLMAAANLFFRGETLWLVTASGELLAFDASLKQTYKKKIIPSNLWEGAFILSRYLVIPSVARNLAVVDLDRPESIQTIALPHPAGGSVRLDPAKRSIAVPLVDGSEATLSFDEIIGGK